MSLRDVGLRGWLLLTSTALTVAGLVGGTVSGYLFRPLWDTMLVGLVIATPVMVLLTVWYFFDVLWGREIRRRRRVESKHISEMATAEALLRLINHADSLLGRLTSYVGWLFFLILLAMVLVPLLFIMGLWAFADGGYAGMVFGAASVVFWVLYFYYYYKVKHENDLWKERIAWLRERERSLVE